MPDFWDLHMTQLFHEGLVLICNDICPDQHLHTICCLKVRVPLLHKEPWSFMHNFHFHFFFSSLKYKF